MPDLQDYFLKVRKKLARDRQINQWLREKIKEVAEEEFPGANVFKYVKSFHLKKGTLFIETNDKVFAQEIYWRTEELKKKINQGKELIVKKIVVR